MGALVPHFGVNVRRRKTCIAAFAADGIGFEAALCLAPNYWTDCRPAFAPARASCRSPRILRTKKALIEFSMTVNNMIEGELCPYEVWTPRRELEGLGAVAEEVDDRFRQFSRITKRRNGAVPTVAHNFAAAGEIRRYDG
jgi:hypothetical protein